MSKRAKSTIIAVASPDHGVRNDPEPLGLAFHHQGSTFLQRTIYKFKTELKTYLFKKAFKMMTCLAAFIMIKPALVNKSLSVLVYPRFSCTLAYQNHRQPMG